MLISAIQQSDSYTQIYICMYIYIYIYRERERDRERETEREPWKQPKCPLTDE